MRPNPSRSARPGPVDRRVFAVWAALLAAILHTACAGFPAADDGRASPSVWSAQLADAGHTFLLGSVHLGSPDMDLGPVAEWVFADAAELVLEVDLSAYGESDSQELANRYGRIPSPQTLQDRISPETYSMLEAYLARRRMFAEPFMHLQPWLVATAITVLEYQDLGYETDLGVDQALLSRAKGRKSIAGLETLESQFALLSGLPAEVQDLMLHDMLKRSESFASEASAMIEAWQSGDDEALSRIVFQDIDQPEFAVFYERILFDRNERMADRIAEMAADGKTRLVVVGAAHMLGDKGIPALLAARGFQVEKVSQ